MLIREAKHTDNEGLLRLTALTTMKGIIDLRIERKPNFFSLLKERGPFFMLVAENNRDIIGSIAVYQHNVLLLGQVRKIYYVCDFKVHPDFQHSSLAYRLVKKLQEYLFAIDADILLCTSILGNYSVEPFFDGRLGIPPFMDMETFNVYQVPLPFKPEITDPYRDNITKEEIDELCDFYNTQANKYTMAPFTRPEDLRDKINLIERKNGQIIAAICLADYLHLKQNVVADMPLYLNILSQTSNLIARLLPAFSLPQKGQPIRLINVKRLAARPECMSELGMLIARARYLLYRNKFTFLTIALHPEDNCHQIFKKLSKFSFYSKVWISSLKGDENLLRTLKKGVLFEDYSLV